MEDKKKANWVSYGFCIAIGLSILSSSLGILQSQVSMKLSQFSMVAFVILMLSQQRTSGRARSRFDP